jgi:D-alanyl-D-alanine carboxypeptidase
MGCRRVSVSRLAQHASLTRVMCKTDAPRAQRTARLLMLAVLLAPAGQRSSALAQVAPAPAMLSPGRATDAMQSYLAAMDAADSVALRVWLTRYDPQGDLVLRTNRQLGLARRTGGFVLESVVRSDEASVEAILRERKSRVQVRMELVLNASGVADGFGLRPLTVHTDAAPPAGAAPRVAPITQRALVSSLRALCDSLARAGAFSGVVSLSRRGAPLFERAYGTADRDTRTANTIETAFNLGSINKIFTSIAIRQLAASGKLSLDSTLARVWPEYPNRDVASRVTIRQLLDHSSGVTGNIFQLPGVAPGDVRHNRQIVAALAATPLAFAPGSRTQYSNAGYVLLGGVIERVSGEEYYAYVQRHILAPAGMTRTGHLHKDSLPARTARGYTTRGEANPSDALVANSSILPGRGSAAGGGYSTVGDLRKFLATLRGGTLAGAPPAGIGIAGGAPGVNAAVDGDLPGGYDIIVLSNLDPPSAERIAERVRAWLGVRD